MNTEDIVVDCKGRILIPKNVRERIGLQLGGKARLKVEHGSVVIMPPISPEEFIKEMEGCIQEGSSKIDPLCLKDMWEPAKKQKVTKK